MTSRGGAGAAHGAPAGTAAPFRRREGAGPLPALEFDDAYFREPQRTLAPLIAAGARAAYLPRLGTVMLLRHADSYAAPMDRRLGANVARMEARVAFEALLGRFGSIGWVGPEPAWAAATALRTLERFPLRLAA